MTLALVVLALSQTAVPTPRELIAGHVQAAGGQAALERVATVVRHGCFEPRPGARCLPVETYAKAPGKWLLRLSIPGVRIFEQGSDGQKAWAQDDEEPSDLPAEERLREDYALDFRLPLRAGEYFEELKTACKRSAGGREVWVVEAKPRGGGKPVELEFDAETGLLARAGDVRFDDYRGVDGVRWPFTVLFIEGQSTQRIVFKEVKVNSAVEDWRFDRLASAAAYRRDLDSIWLPQLETGLRGIDPGPARAMFEQLRSFAPQDGRILYDLIVEHSYRRAIEIGTARGNSALWIALALKKTGGKLLTIEIDPELAKAAAANFLKAGLADVVECRNNDAFKEVPAIEGDFDFVFLDTGTSMHKRFMELVYPARLKTGGAVVSHNANGFAEQQPDFLKAITEDPMLDTKTTRTPGGGVSVSIKKAGS
jgi:caffeoyl-CoA O-methyltransferase